MTQYFRVPHHEKDQAKSLGARWDAQLACWYASDEQSIQSLMAHWRSIPPPPQPIDKFPGEDLSWGSALAVDMLPSSCWQTTLDSCISKADDKRIRLGVRQRCQNRCQLCQEQEDPQRGIYLGVHPRYEFTEGRQILRRLMGVCSTCQAAIEFGQTQSCRSDEFRLDEHARRHLQHVNGWTPHQTQQHIQQAFAVWEARSRVSWTLDLSIVEAAGVSVVLPTAEQRQKAGVNLDTMDVPDSVSKLLAAITEATSGSASAPNGSATASRVA